jgi:hypothetical protein
VGVEAEAFERQRQWSCTEVSGKVWPADVDEMKKSELKKYEKVKERIEASTAAAYHTWLLRWRRELAAQSEAKAAGADAGGKQRG